MAERTSSGVDGETVEFLNRTGAAQAGDVSWKEISRQCSERPGSCSSSNAIGAVVNNQIDKTAAEQHVPPLLISLGLSNVALGKVKELTEKVSNGETPLRGTIVERLTSMQETPDFKLAYGVENAALDRYIEEDRKLGNALGRLSGSDRQ